MSDHSLSREFSICLVPDAQITEQILSIRQQLAPSPYRNDRPHLTLLRGISSPAAMTDRALVGDLEKFLSLSTAVPISATIKDVANGSNQFYSLSSGLLVEPDDALIELRQRMVTTLLQRGYSVEPQEQQTYLPHITIRLGVPLEDRLLEAAQNLFRSKQLSFNGWLLLRLIEDSSTRQVHEVYPYNL